MGSERNRHPKLILSAYYDIINADDANNNSLGNPFKARNSDDDNLLILFAKETSK